MADEYIRREDALKGKKTGTFANGICFVAEPCVTVEYIESLEPADVVSVVHGEWERIPYSFAGGYRCSCCGQKTMENFWLYCPNCGAKMDAKE